MAPLGSLGLGTGSPRFRSHFYRAGVGLEALGSGECGYGWSEFRQCGLVQLLRGDDLEVVGDREAASLTGGSAGGEDVVGAGGVVSGGFGAVGSEEDAS